MCPAVDNVHHRDGEHVRRNAAYIAVQRQPARICCGFRHGKADPEDRIRAQPRLIFGAIKRDHRAVNLTLIFGLKPAQFVSNLSVYAVNCLPHAFAKEASRITVTQFNRLIRAS